MCIMICTRLCEMEIQKKLKEKNTYLSYPSINSEVLIVGESYTCFEFGSHWQDEASTSRRALLFGSEKSCYWK